MKEQEKCLYNIIKHNQRKISKGEEMTTKQKAFRTRFLDCKITAMSERFTTKVKTEEGSEIKIDQNLVADTKYCHIGLEQI